MALSTVRSIVRAKDVIVLGSAPITPQERSFIETSPASLICVNGSISSTSRDPSLWLLNSRNYSDPLYTNNALWPSHRKELHHAMMEQAKDRHARHILFLLKNDNELDSINLLKSYGTTWRAYSTLHAGMRTDLVRKAGVHRFVTAFNVSAGLVATCIPLAFKARSVTLLGFSFKDGYAYIPSALSGTRLHIDQDKEAIKDLLSKHPSLAITPPINPISLSGIA